MTTSILSDFVNFFTKPVDEKLQDLVDTRQHNLDTAKHVKDEVMKQIDERRKSKKAAVLKDIEAGEVVKKLKEELEKAETNKASTSNIAEAAITLSDGLVKRLLDKYFSTNRVKYEDEIRAENAKAATEEPWFIKVKTSILNNVQDNKHYYVAAGTLATAAVLYGIYNRMKDERKKSIMRMRRSRSSSRSGRSRSRSLSRSRSARSESLPHARRISSRSLPRPVVSTKDVQRAEQAFKEAKAKAEHDAKKLEGLVNRWSSKNIKKHGRRTRSL